MQLLSMWDYPHPRPTLCQNTAEAVHCVIATLVKNISSQSEFTKLCYYLQLRQDFMDSYTCRLKCKHNMLVHVHYTVNEIKDFASGNVHAGF